MPRSLLAAFGTWLHGLRYNYLVVPGSIAVGFAGLGVALTLLDRQGGSEGVATIFAAGPAAARTFLATTAAAVATIAGVAFSITIVSLQLVSQQFTPRALRGFLGDRLNQTVAGVFIGVFLYCLVALRSVEEGEEQFVPGLALGVGMGLAFVALALLLVFVHHMGHSIQVSTIARRIARETLQATERLYPHSYGQGLDDVDPDALVAGWEQERESALVHPEEPGFVQSVDDIPGTIGGRSFAVELLVAPGDFVTPRHPIARVWTQANHDECVIALRRAVAIRAERDVQQDVGYGVRQLADIAVKALSPSVNDPTTATTCIGYLQAVLERIAQTRSPARVRRFPDQDVMLVMRRDAFRDYLESLIQISRYATADARPVEALVRAALRVSQAAAEAGAPDRSLAAQETAQRIARRALDSQALDEEERAAIEDLVDATPDVAAHTR